MGSKDDTVAVIPSEAKGSVWVCGAPILTPTISYRQATPVPPLRCASGSERHLLRNRRRRVLRLRGAEGRRDEARIARRVVDDRGVDVGAGRARLDDHAEVVAFRNQRKKALNRRV